MDSLYRFLTLGIPWTQSMPSRDVNAATRLAEDSRRRDKVKQNCCLRVKGPIPANMADGLLLVVIFKRNRPA